MRGGGTMRKGLGRVSARLLKFMVYQREIISMAHISTAASSNICVDVLHSWGSRNRTKACVTGIASKSHCKIMT